MVDNRIRFHEPHLQAVSRSFAFGISRLKRDLRASVGLAYLICRILDTIEDAQWTDSWAQQQAFDTFDACMTNAPLETLSTWVQGFPKSINNGERALIADAAKIFTEFHSLTLSEKSAMLDPILSMSRGMREFALRAHREDALRPILKLRDLADVNTYCFFVAGVVGELLTRLVEEEIILRPNGLKLSDEDGIHFGLFLQKINVLKDQWPDEKENRFLVPDREAMLKSLRRDAQGALRYLESIPLERQDYRLFCAWSLFLGLATVPLLRESEKPVDGAEGTAPKLSRLRATALGVRIEIAIGNPARTAALANELVVLAWPESAPSLMSTLAPTAAITDDDRVSTILESCYSGRIDLGSLRTLLTER